MQAVTGIVLLAMFGLSTVVGLRLLRIPGQSGLSAERCLGWFFLVGHVIGGILTTAAYGIWAHQGNPESSGALSALHATLGAL